MLKEPLTNLLQISFNQANRLFSKNLRENMENSPTPKGRFNFILPAKLKGTQGREYLIENTRLFVACIVCLYQELQLQWTPGLHFWPFLAPAAFYWSRN